MHSISSRLLSRAVSMNTNVYPVLNAVLLYALHITIIIITVIIIINIFKVS